MSHHHQQQQQQEHPQGRNQVKIITNPYAKRKATSVSSGTTTTTTATATTLTAGIGNQSTFSSTNRNPYSIKRSRQQQEQQQSAFITSNNNIPSRPTTTTTTTATSHNATTKTSFGWNHNTNESSERTMTSFSQAFEAVENTDHYKQQLSLAAEQSGNNCHVMNDIKKAASLRAQQREFDQQQRNTSSTTIEEDAILKAAIAVPPKEFAGNNNTLSSSSSSKPFLFQNESDHHILFQQPHVLYVSTKQKGNGILQYIRNVPMTYQTMVPDYIMSTTRCALFLSIKYHNLYPEYIYRRIAALKLDFELRILLVLVDVDDNASVLLQLNKLAVVHNLTLILAWSEEEAGRYLETYKAFDGKDSKSIQKKESTYFGDQVSDFLCTKKTGINKTDSALLIQQFNTITSLSIAAMDELATIPGMGEVKVKRFYEAFHKPFSKKLSKQRIIKQQQQQQQQQQKELLEKQQREEEEQQQQQQKQSLFSIHEENEEEEEKEEVVSSKDLAKSATNL